MRGDSYRDMELRAAVEGEVLVVCRFKNGLKGLTSPNYHDALKESRIAAATMETKSVEPPNEYVVCIPDGAEVVMLGISPEFRSRHGFSATEVVIFRQLSDDEFTHWDAVEFRNEVIIPLEELELDQRIGVLALSKEESIIRSETLGSTIAL